ncbi:MAG TPA: hypothetical protein VIM14_00520 [Polyangia bacterium]
MTRFVAYTACYFSLAVCIVACNPKEDQGSEFAAGVPRASTVAMAVPGSDSMALTVEEGRSALDGQIAEWYVTTRNVTMVVNAGAVAVGALVKLVTNYPPTSVALDSAVWGPWQGPLDPVEWKVTVTRLAPHQYQYKFEGRDKHNQAADFVTVLSGKHWPGLDAQGREMEGFGSGSFTLDWNARATLPQPDSNIGTASYAYSHTDPAAVVTIDAQFRQVKDDKQPGRLVDVDYAFVQNPGADGSMDFLYNVPAIGTTAGGLGKAHSRWQWSGAGRSDVSVTATDSPLTYTLSECWDTSYISVYKSVPLSTSATDNYGSESSCVYPTAQPSKL